MSIPTIDMPNETLTPLPSDKEPNAYVCRILKREVMANARSIPSTHGGGNHGHLGLVLTAADYAVVLGAAAPAAFVIPPRPTRTALAPGAGAVAAVNAESRYQEELQMCNVCIAVQQKLRTQILKAVPEIYLEVLADPDYGFATVTVEQMVTHLITTYGDIGQSDLDKNLKSLEDPWDPETPIEKVFSDAIKRRAFAVAGGEAIPDGVALRALIKAFEKSGVLSEGIKDWYKKPTADQTYINLMPHFKAANKERIRTTTSAQAGYGTHDRANAATVTIETNAVNTANAAVTTGSNANANAAPDFITTMSLTDAPYCWSHGLGWNRNHTSPTCTNRAEGHQENAIVTDMLGGNNTIRRKRGERAVYRRPN